ncbi:MAG: hypothetical protein ACT4NU_01860 [Chromatiales bacterium]
MPFAAVNKPWKGALSRLFSRPFRLISGERVLVFRHPSEFEFALGGRVSVSLVKLVEFLHRSPKSLRREAIFVSLIQHQLTRVLGACRERPDKTGALLKAIGMKSFTTEYRWRTIFEALASGGQELNEYRQVALVRYLQYLESRCDALGIVYFHKTGKALIEQEQEISARAANAASFEPATDAKVSAIAEDKPPAATAYDKTPSTALAAARG